MLESAQPDVVPNAVSILEGYWKVNTREGLSEEIMQEYKTENIRNVAVVAHSNAGKTSLIEAILLNGGTIDRLGSVDEGNSVADYATDEIDRKMTINCSICVAEWKGHKINLIDTPGAEDLYGDLASALRVVEAVIIVIDATTGVEAGTEKIWESIQRQKIPSLFFVNKMDKEGADFKNAVSTVEDVLEARPAIVQLPIGAESDFSSVFDLIHFDDENIPEDLIEEAQEDREMLTEAAAESDEELIEKFFEDGELTGEEIELGIRNGLESGEIIPAISGSATQNIGVEELMNFLISCCPSPASVDLDEENAFEPDPSAPLSALVFKTLADPFSGRLTLFRVFSGTLSGDSQLRNSTKSENERIGKISFMNGKELTNTPQVAAGDFGVAIKLNLAETGDTFCTVDDPIQLPGIDLPNPVISLAVLPARDGDDEKLSTSLQRMSEEDPTFQISRNETTRQLLVSGLGELHITIVRNRMQDKFGIETLTEDPKIPYRETVRGRANNVRGRLKKQSGGRGQFGEVWIHLEPLSDSEEMFEFVDNIVGGSVPRNYIPAVEKGIRDTMTKGVLAGYPLYGLRVTLYDGKHHPVDSSDMAFQLAGSQAIRDAVETAKPILLEPVYNISVTVPDQYMGDVMGDLNSKRGRIMGMEQVGKRQVIQATAPLSELSRYSIDLKSLTSARGSFTMEYDSYEQIPDEIAQKVIADSKSENESE